jgi:hypothetical protein
MWSSSQHYAPTILLDVDDTRLSLRQLFNYRGMVPYSLDKGFPSSCLELPRRVSFFTMAT